MILDSDLPELKAYRELEHTLPIRFAPELSRLVISSDNDSLPVHRWFKYKEAYSPAILSQVLAAHDVVVRRPASLLDPFCGVGTTLLTAQVLPNHFQNAVGIERNPFAAYVARTKLCWPEINPVKIRKMAESVLSEATGVSSDLPSLSSISTGRCISRHVAGRLIAIRDVILSFPSSPARAVLLLGLASAIEPLSRVRKDGRALRLVEKKGQRVVPTLRSKWEETVTDILQMQSRYSRFAPTKVYEGDGREPGSIGLERGTIDMVFTSPPYPNNIDYSEVYKLELWLLGFIASSEEFLKLRKSTLRSHPTSDLDGAHDVRFVREITSGSLSRSFSPLVNRTNSFKEKWRTKLALGYFSDIWVSLKQQYGLLRKSGRAFLVVANSLHGGADGAYLVPTDLLLAQIGQSVGFQLESILVARNTRRRLSGNHFLRESVVVLRKPNAV